MGLNILLTYGLIDWWPNWCYTLNYY